MNFKQFQNGMCDGFVLVKKCEIKKTKNGSSYLYFMIGDQAGEKPGKRWGFKPGGRVEGDMGV